MPDPALWEFLTKKGEGGKEEYSLAHYWTNFEVRTFVQGAGGADERADWGSEVLSRSRVSGAVQGA